MTSRSSVALADRKRQLKGVPSTDQVVSWVQFPVGAGSSHTKDFKNRTGPCLHGTQDEVGTTKHNWSARCQYNVTGWVSMWAYDMLALYRGH